MARILQTEPHYYRWEFSKALGEAVKTSDFCTVRWLLKHFLGSVISRDVVSEAARGGQLAILQMLEVDEDFASIKWTEGCLKEAADRAHWHIVRWLLSRIGMTSRREDPRSKWR